MTAYTPLAFLFMPGLKSLLCIWMFYGIQFAVLMTSFVFDLFNKFPKFGNRNLKPESVSLDLCRITSTESSMLYHKYPVTRICFVVTGYVIWRRYLRSGASGFNFASPKPLSAPRSIENTVFSSLWKENLYIIKITKMWSTKKLDICRKTHAKYVNIRGGQNAQIFISNRRWNTATWRFKQLTN
jgi:hypothetical protein